jgi:hypothetical protein
MGVEHKRLQPTAGWASTARTPTDFPAATEMRMLSMVGDVRTATLFPREEVKREALVSWDLGPGENQVIFFAMDVMTTE